jgi:hypothetical protein
MVPPLAFCLQQSQTCERANLIRPELVGTPYTLAAQTVIAAQLSRRSGDKLHPPEKTSAF